MRKYVLLSCCLGLCLFCWLCPQFAEGQFGALEEVLNGKDKDKEAKKEPPKKGGGVFGFGETLEDSAITLGIATQESQLKSCRLEIGENSVIAVTAQERQMQQGAILKEETIKHCYWRKGRGIDGKSKR